MDQFTLAGDFPLSTEAEWLALAEKALGEASFDVLRTQLHEGIETEPLYTESPKSPPLFGSRGWRVVQPLTDSAEQFNGDLANGADAFVIDLAAISAETAANLKNFPGSDIDYYIAPGSALADAALVLAAAGESAITGSAGFDPLTAVAASGEAPAEKSALLADYADAAFFIREHHPACVPFLASGHAWDGAGGSAVQELAFTLAAAVSYWRGLSAAGMATADSVRSIGFSLAASADIFLTIAKFRAKRLLWARALNAAGETPAEDLLLLGRMSGRILGAYDPHVNLLRGTAAAFGAAIGGATGIEVLPFDSAAEGASTLSRRMARNTSLILQHESYLSAVADAAAGSAYLESLTYDLAAAAWNLFRDVEARGGLFAANSGASQMNGNVAWRSGGTKSPACPFFPTLPKMPRMGRRPSRRQANSAIPSPANCLHSRRPEKGKDSLRSSLRPAKDCPCLSFGWHRAGFPPSLRSPLTS
jgi:methylmalonyl-CoA mutase